MIAHRFRPSRRSLALRAALSPRCSLARRRRRRMTKIERVVSPGGIEAWLVRDATVPLIAIEFAFRGGADQDPAGQAGRRQHGGRAARRGRRRARRQGVPRSGSSARRSSCSFRAGRDYFRGTLRTLKDNRDEAFDLLRLALTEPRFDAERGRAHPRADACRGCSARPRARTTSPAAAGGRPPSPIIPTAGRSTARSNRCRRITRRRPAGLCAPRAGARQSQDRRRRRHRRRRPPARCSTAPSARCRPRPSSSRSPTSQPQGLGSRIVVELDVPQAVVTFGGPGIARNDPDFMAGLYRQPHPRRRLVLLAALSRGAREARPRLWRLRQPGLARPRRAADRRHRHPRRRAPARRIE